LSQSLIANIQGLKELEEGEEVDIEVSPSILNIEENDQPDNLQGVNTEIGNHSDSSSPVG
jgi:ribosomal protein L21E